MKSILSTILLSIFFSIPLLWIPQAHSQSRAYVAETSDCANYVFKGTGQQSSPFLIQSVGEFKCFVYYTKTFSTRGQFWNLRANLDFTGELGRELMIPLFEGVFDGRYFHIKGLYIDCKTNRSLCQSNIGLFQNTSNAKIMNLFLDNARVVVGQNPIYDRIVVGSLVGFGQLTEIFRISVTSQVEVYGGENIDGTSSVGGAIGALIYSTLSESKAESSLLGTVTPYTIGLLLGSPCSATIKNSYAKGDAQNATFVGGIAGGCHLGTLPHRIENSFFVGRLTVDLNPFVDGFVTPLGWGQGLNENSTFINSFWSGSSNRNPIFPIPYLAIPDQNWLLQNFLNFRSVWKARTNDWPELQWIIKVTSERTPL